MRTKIPAVSIKKHVQDYSSIYTFIAVLFVMGVIFGAIMVNGLSEGQKEDLFYYLHQFFGQVADGKMVPAEELLKESFLHNIKFMGLIWILGISIIGLPLIFILVFLKGVVVGFSVGFLVHQMGWNGFLLSFITILPQNLLIIPAYLFVSAASVGLSTNLIRKLFMRQTAGFHIVPELARYAMVFVIAAAIVTVSVSYEAYISPLLMKSLVSSLSL